MKRILITFLLLLPVLTTFAQFDFTFITTQWDSSYYDRYFTKWSVRAYSVSKDQNFSLINRISNERIDYKPNSRAAVGLGVTYGNYSLDVGVAISNKKDDPNNATKTFDFMSGLYTAQHIFDFSFQWYAGFFSEYRPPSGDTVDSHFRSDIRTFNTGINYNYNFNYGRYSFNAPFIGTQVQKKSAGAPLAGLFFFYYDLRSNTTIIPVSADSAFNKEARMEEANLFTSGFLAGYAYTLVLPAHFSITASLIPGISFNTGDVKTEKYYEIGHPLTVSPKLVSRNSIGYAGKKFYSLISYIYDGNFVNLGHKNQFNYNLSKVKFLVGYRIE